MASRYDIIQHNNAVYFSIKPSNPWKKRWDSIISWLMSWLPVLVALALYYAGIGGDFYALVKIYDDDNYGHACFYALSMLVRMFHNAIVLAKHDQKWYVCIPHISRIFMEFDKSIKGAVLKEFDHWQYFGHIPLENLILIHWSFTRFNDMQTDIIMIILANSLASTYFLSLYDAFPSKIRQDVEFSFKLLWKLKSLMIEHFLSTSWIWLSWSYLLLVTKPIHLVAFGFLALVAGFILLFCFASELVKTVSTPSLVWSIVMNVFGISWISKKTFILSHRLVLLFGALILGYFNYENLNEDIKESSFGSALILTLVLACCFALRRVFLWQPYFSSESEKILDWYESQPSSRDANSSLRERLLENANANYQQPILAQEDA